MIILLAYILGAVVQNIFNLPIQNLVIIAIFALIGFFIGTFKFPEIGAFKFTKKVGGENIDDVIKRAIMFKKKGKRIYLYTKEEKKNG